MATVGSGCKAKAQPLNQQRWKPHHGKQTLEPTSNGVEVLLESSHSFIYIEAGERTRHRETLASTMLALYRAYNGAEQAKLAFDSDFGAALEEPSAGRFGRGYLGYWETRNLRMASNIRDMFAAHPGIRGLVIVGASHKPYLESYLNHMHDMTVVDAEAVLR